MYLRTVHLKAIPDRTLAIAANICRDQYHNVQNKIGLTLKSLFCGIICKATPKMDNFQETRTGRMARCRWQADRKLNNSFPSIIWHLRDILQQVTDFSHCWPICRIIGSACPDQVNQFSWGFVWNNDFCDVQAHVGFPQGANLQFVYSSDD